MIPPVDFCKKVNWNIGFVNTTCSTHPETSSRGGLIPEMIQECDYDILIVLVELNTLVYVGPLNEWQILELGHFEVRNFEKKIVFSHKWGVLEHRSRA